ncbi:uncharacterized protein EKO05_0011129 [Ascochyta rabiei]|uniref:Uncharacterized protein n=1 Tax=Didymella rabiei TaxID=5454 RepID=A0A163A9A4_DIDRA|nr:uncharacterized protein EKO05_0011129 [Ascochyta rabiei]KZM21057.1 hypothetical protein ST47_g7805 [Ascochyta rabiei]UPX20917.1 hypothetical protein EKO05_0011129 [Ascochyta rabiei]
MLYTPFSRLNISCTCIECTTFIRPYPTSPPLLGPPPGLGFDLASILPTAATTPERTARSTPRLAFAAPALAPSPSFLVTRPTTKTLKLEAIPRTKLPIAWTPLDEYLKKVTLASRSLWAGISSPIDEDSTPISAKTPGLACCASAGCSSKVMPGFGKALCKVCLGELRDSIGAALAEATEEPEAQRLPVSNDTRSRADSLLSRTTTTAGPAQASRTAPEALAADHDASPLSSPNSLASTTSTVTAPTHSPPPPPPVLPNPPLTPPDTPHEAMTPTTNYALHFPALPAPSSSSRCISRRSSVSRPWSQSSSSSSSSSRARDCRPLQPCS